MKTVNLLWTGGWDSTFRLLQLVLEYKVAVQPIYLIDLNRKSFPVEIATIQRIKHAVEDDHPAAQGLILPTKYYLIEDIVSEPEIERHFDTLLAQRYLGIQYKHFANLIKGEDLAGMELSIHKDDRAHLFLEKYCKQTQTPFGSSATLDAASAPEALSIFSKLTFPLFDITKTDMHRHSLEKGFEKYMNMTWFCYHPVGGEMIPCGRCNPCKYTKSEDMAWRVPRFPRLVLIRMRSGRFIRKCRAFIHDRVSR